MENTTSIPWHPTPENIKDASELADIIVHIHWSVMLSLAPKFSQEWVSFQQYFLLNCLTSVEHLTMSDIAKKIGHSTAAATGIVDRLEKMQLAERIHDQEDRRKIMVSLSTKGVDFVARIREEISKKLQEMLKNSD